MNETLQKIDQRTAAWILGISPRVLRDIPEIRRSEDGKHYHIHDLLEHAREQNAAKYEFANGDQETALRVVESIDFVGDAPQVTRALETILKRLGSRGATAFLGLMVDHVRECYGSEPGPLTATVCDECGRLRNGRVWTQSKPPEKVNVRKCTCPECRKD